MKEGSRSTHGDVQQPQLRGQMERRVAIVRKVRVLHALGVVFDDAFEEGEVSEVDGSADADGDVNPFPGVYLLRTLRLESMLGTAGLTWFFLLR